MESLVKTGPSAGGEEWGRFLFFCACARVNCRTGSLTSVIRLKNIQVNEKAEEKISVPQYL